MPADQRKGFLGVELAGAMREHRHPEIKARQKHVEEPADPRPIGRGPVEIARLRKEIVRQLHPGQVPEQHAVGMQRALRLSGGARRVDDQRRVVLCRIGRREMVAGALQGRPEQPVSPAIAVDHQDCRELRQAARHLREVFAVGNEGPGAAVGEAMLERVGAELDKEGHRHGAQLVDRQMRDRGLRPLRQEDPDPVAGPDAEPGQRVGAAVREALQIVKAETLDRAVGRLVDQRQPAVAGGVPVAGGNADIEALRHLPAEGAVDLVIAVAAVKHGDNSSPVPGRGARPQSRDACRAPRRSCDGAGRPSIAGRAARPPPRSATPAGGCWRGSCAPRRRSRARVAR